MGMFGLKTRTLLVAAAALGVTVAAFSINSSVQAQQVALEQCQCNGSASTYDIDMKQACNHQAQQSWFAWLTGDSRSAQFHYLDLLELLTRDDNKSRQFSSKSY
tara:strand:+ start:8158 stop:8469 length:312 start_codon:yes stop_codon:yes gene_type:complete